MAENTIDNLSIQVTASAENAARVFDRLASSAGRLKGAASGVVGSMNSIGDSASKAADGVGKVSEAAKDMGMVTSKSAEQTGESVEELKRKIDGVNKRQYSSAGAGVFAYLKKDSDVLQMKLEGAKQRLADLLNADTQDNRAIANATAEVKRLQDALVQAKKKEDEFGQGAKDAGDNAKKGASGLAKFWQSLKRIAFYRFVRSVIRSITDAFKTGITNLYQWSAAVNGTFAKSMDRIATSTLYLKNSLGAMLAPIIERLTPVIEWIIDRIVDVINWINKLFAALSGSQTYTVAKKVATKWQEAGTSAASSAKKAADDIKRTILGFDEINKLEKQNTSGGSGGSGSSSPGTDYTNMFEERKLDGWMSKLSAFINKFNLGVPAVLGGILAGWIAIKAAIKAVAKLSLGWLKSLAGKTVDIAVSLVRKGWTTIKNWALSFGQAVIDCFVSIKTKAAELWVKFAAAWAALNPVLKVGIVASVTAAALWLAYKAAWALVPDKMLQVEAAIKTAPQALKQWLQDRWKSLGTWSLGVSVSIVTLASALKNKLVSAWEKLGEWSLGVSVSIITAVSMLKNKLISAWNSLGNWALSVGVKLASTANQLWESLKSAWDIGTRVLQIGVSFVNSKVGSTKSLSESPSKSARTTTASDTSIPKSLSIGALATSIAIVMPWKDLSLQASKLWSNATKSLSGVSGALSFSMIPTFDIDQMLEWRKKIQAARRFGFPVTLQIAKFGHGVLTVASDVSNGLKSWVEDAYAFLREQTPAMKLNACVELETRPGNGFSGGSSGNTRYRTGPNSYTLDPTIQKSIENNPLVVPVDAKPSWGKGSIGHIGKSILSYLGLVDLNTTVNIGARTSWGRQDPISYLGLGHLATTIAVYLEPKTKEIKLNGGGGGTWRLMTKALGGILSNGLWSDIPQYAGGTAGVNHGSLFWAGENGAEIVGNAGGRTEVLNRSQIASSIFSAVRAAMAPAASNFAAAAQYMNVGNSEYDNDSLMDMIQRAVEAAMSRSNDYDRQKLELLRQINDKEFKAEVTTASINSAQTRFNRRAGVTVVPVG